jgi:superfamily II DNA helicase RecQ
MNNEILSKENQKSISAKSNAAFIEAALQVRLMEMEAQEEMLKAIATIHERKIWRQDGYRSLPAFCMDRFGYNRHEARELAVAVGAILTSEQLRVESPEAQFRLEALREWRRLLARAKGVPSYRIFSNRMLVDLATTNPRTLEDLKKIKGFGLKKTEAFGSQLVSHLNALPQESLQALPQDPQRQVNHH